MNEAWETSRDCIRCDRTLVTTNLTCMKPNTFVWLTTCANACYAMLRRFFVLPAMWLKESPLLAMLCYVLCVFCSPTAKWRQRLSFSPIGAEMAEMHVFNKSLFPSVCGGRGRPLQTQSRSKHLDHAPCLQSRPYPYPSPTQTDPHLDYPQPYLAQ